MAYEITFEHAFQVAERDHYINDCCFGGDVIVRRLLPIAQVEGNRELDSEQEDWGWFIWFKRGDTRMSIDVTCHDIESGQFAIRVAAKRPRLLRSDIDLDTAALDLLRDAVVDELRRWLGVEPLVSKVTDP